MTHVPPEAELETESGDWRSQISGIIEEARALFRTEFQLAKTELTENAVRAGGGLVMFVIAALIALVALNALAVAAVMGVVALGLAVGWAALIVSGVFLVLALIFAMVGKSRLSAATLTPKRTIKQVKSDVNAVKEMSRA